MLSNDIGIVCGGTVRRLDMSGTAPATCRPATAWVRLLVEVCAGAAASELPSLGPRDPLSATPVSEVSGEPPSPLLGAPSASLWFNSAPAEGRRYYDAI